MRHFAALLTALHVLPLLGACAAEPPTEGPAPEVVAAAEARGYRVATIRLGRVP